MLADFYHGVRVAPRSWLSPTMICAEHLELNMPAIFRVFVQAEVDLVNQPTIAALHEISFGYRLHPLRRLNWFASLRNSHPFLLPIARTTDYELVLPKNHSAEIWGLVMFRSAN